MSSSPCSTPPCRPGEEGDRTPSSPEKLAGSMGKATAAVKIDLALTNSERERGEIRRVVIPPGSARTTDGWGSRPRPPVRLTSIRAARSSPAALGSIRAAAQGHSMDVVAEICLGVLHRRQCGEWGLAVGRRDAARGRQPRKGRRGASRGRRPKEEIEAPPRRPGHQREGKRKWV